MRQGLVIKSTGSWYQVKSDDGEIVECKIRGKFRTQGIKTTNPLAVGDIVDFKTDEKTGSHVIFKIHPRKNYIIRKSINLSKQSHILAANIDQAVLIVTLVMPKTYPEFIDRFLVSAEAYSIPAKIIFNKIDLYNNAVLKEMNELISTYESIGYECFAISAKQKQGIDKIDKLLSGKISVFAGHSGIGKSTLINTIQPGLSLKTMEISDHHDSGMHTTTFPEMHALDNKGYIIDTPGIKGLGVVDIEKEEISHYFPEMFKKSEKCQFYNCTHSHEPNCAVRKAVQEGEISEKRYKSYVNLLVEDDDEKYRTNPY
ncbi:MAG: ribosome small subunit-dependent GTPase A [Salinivirgaceae bacterium]|nr:ribosome small subunit-dependent GTPase A [Salinivirgaceae bacterium]